jgi:hypothetical protein
MANEPPEPTRAQKAFFWFGVLFIAATVLAVAFFLYVASNSG